MARARLIWYIPAIILIMVVLTVVGLVDMMIPEGMPPTGVVRSPDPPGR